MKRILVGLFAVMLLVGLSSSGLSLLRAASPAQATPAAQTWTPGTLVRVKAAVPFVWLRVAASPVSAVMATVQSGDYLVIAGSSATWDGAQWWWLTRWGPLKGYVEEQSLDLVIPGPAGSATSAAPTATAQSPQPTATIPVTPAITAPPSSTAQAWTAGTQLHILASIPFVWVRAAPSSSAPVVETIHPSDTLVVTGTSPSAWDGTQWWWNVNRPGTSAYGWVEENRVTPAPISATSAATVAATTAGATSGAPTPTAITTGAGAAPWAVNNVLAIKNGIAFAWMRTSPNSTSPIQWTLYPGWLVLVDNGTPVWDGSQWWWHVYQPSSNQRGWVEQNSLS